MMDQAIRDFAKQFKFRPKIENGTVKKFKRFVVAGMGGSHLAGDIIKTLNPGLEIIIWPNYGLPQIDWKKTLLIASSYSGNTEEPIDSLNLAIEKNLPVAAIAIGGKLLEIAKQKSVPYIQLPDTGIQPRCALGFSIKAMLKLMKQNDLLKASAELSKSLKLQELEEQGKSLAARIKNHAPVIYASAGNFSVAYVWKIKFNETGKIPAFYNVFPELNHNEINGFDVKDASQQLSKNLYFIFLRDQNDHEKIKRRMEVTKKLYQDRGLPVEVLEFSGDNALQKIFSSLVLADWTAYYTAEGYGLESEQVPMVEELKKLIAN
ncbi:MAG: bifunctional phosphoglucose/phosphomannose isomerase [bacterium]|nr:bifunctional phosphoglucose/phosphomannose isomerase [bacterium]